MDTTFGSLLSQLEKERRAKNYDAARAIADDIEEQRLAINGDPLVQSRVMYELHMASYQQWKDNPSYGRKHLDESLQYALRASQSASVAGDILGKLFADMNVSGLIYPALGLYESALELSRQTSTRAESYAAETRDEDDRGRAHRVAMNCYIHRIRILVSTGGSRMDVDDLLFKLGQNPLYRELDAKGEQWLKKDMASAAAYIAG